jgi:hypothetical protein
VKIVGIHLTVDSGVLPTKPGTRLVVGDAVGF